MFTVETNPFGQFTEVKLTNTQTGEYFSFIPEFGVTLNQLVLGKHGRLYKLLDCSTSYQDLITEGKRMFKGSKLSPFPNRINCGRYTFNGKKYQLPINFSAEGHAIHGLVLEEPFTVTDEKTSVDKAMVQTEYHYQGTNPAYPFCYKLTINYSFSKKDGVRCQTRVYNTGNQNMPLGDGWHPYFQTGSKVNELILTLAANQVVAVDNHMIPTGKILKQDKFTQVRKIGKHIFDTCYKLKPRKGVAETKIEDTSLGITLVVWQETGKDKYNFLQVYTPPSRDCVAIEPITCAPDAFNNHQGLIILKPDKHWQASYGIKIS